MTYGSATTSATWSERSSRGRRSRRRVSFGRWRGAVVCAAVVAALGAGFVPLLHAQDASRWTLAHGASSSTVQEHGASGFAAVPVSALQALGVAVGPARGGTRLVVGDAEVILQAGSPFFTVNGRVRQMVNAPYTHGGTLYVPMQLVVEQLPGLLRGELAVDLGARAVRRSGGATRAPESAARPPSASDARPAATLPASRAAAEPPRPAAAAPVQARRAAAPAAPARKRLVVIDAGHGGVDPGAIGPAGVREKDVALAVARRLAAILREDPSFEVRMTRDRDTLVALTDRTRLANRWRAEGQDALFMSIHTNAHDRASVRGFETFFLSEARTEDARRVAQMENAAQQYESPTRQLDPLSFIMHDLRQNKYLRDSSDWAAMIQNRLAAVHPGPNRGVKQAGFVVLNGAFMPAVLVELGFITHPAEEKMLSDSAYQGRLARQLAAGVRDFFEQSPSSPRAR